MEETTENKSAWSWMGFIFSTAYYAGYGKMKKAFLIYGIMLIGIVVLPVVIKVMGMPEIVGTIVYWGSIIGVSVYTGLNARKDLPIKEVPFSWKDVIIFILAVLAISVIITMVIMFMFAGALLSSGADVAASMGAMQ